MITIDNIEAEELVCKHVYSVHGKSSLKFADERLIKFLRWFRNAIDRPVIINTWASKGKWSQRGYRCNLCSLVKDKTAEGELYASAHTRFQAVDFDVQDMLAEEVRQWLVRHAKEIPVNIRIEEGVSWVHVDVANDTYNKIITFKP